MRGHPGERLVAVAASTYAAALVVRGHAFFLRPYATWLSVDEGYISAFALRLLEGHMLPYVDAISQRGPLLYWFAAAAAAFDRSSFAPIRVLACLVAVATTLLTFAACARGRRPIAGAIAALAYPIGSMTLDVPRAAMGYNGEVASLPFAMGALLALVAGLDADAPAALAVAEPRDAADERAAAPSRFAPRADRVDVRLVALAGALAASAALVKQLAFAFTLPLFAWTIAAALAREGAGGARSVDRARAPVAFVAGFAAPLAAVTLVYAVAGHLDALVYWTITYNATVYMAPFTRAGAVAFLTGFVDSYPLQLTAGAALVAATLAPVAAAAVSGSAHRVARAFDARGLDVTAALGAIASLAAALASLRANHNYLAYCIPWFGLVLGLAMERLASRTPAGFTRALTLLVPVAVLAAFGVSERLGTWRRERASGVFGDPARDPVCIYVKAHSRPGDALFTWGFSAEYVVGCARRPASRFVFSAPVAGWVPYFETTIGEEDRLAAPHSHEQLLADLEETKPPVVVDAPEALAGRSMRRYRDLAAYLDAHYCLAATLGKKALYQRRGTDAACP
jgi:hypothetical protein